MNNFTNLSFDFSLSMQPLSVPAELKLKLKWKLLEIIEIVQIPNLHNLNLLNSVLL